MTAETSLRVRSRTLRLVRIALIVGFLTPSALPGQETEGELDCAMTTVVRVDQTGVASGRFLNAMLPFGIIDRDQRVDRLLASSEPSIQKPEQRKLLRQAAAATCMERSAIEFFNEDPTRTLLITLVFQKRAKKPGAEEAVALTPPPPPASESPGEAEATAEGGEEPGSEPRWESVQQDLQSSGVEDEFRALVGNLTSPYLEELPPESDLNCKNGRCSFRFLVAPGVAVPLNGNILSLVEPLTVLTFTVDYFNDDSSVPNRRGYLYAGWPLNPEEDFDPTPGAKDKTEPLKYPESDSKTAWKFSGFVALAYDPALDRFTKEDEEAKLGMAGKVKPINASEPYGGGSVDRLPAQARLEVDSNLGSRAVAEATFQFKSGDLGEKEATRDVVVPTYRFQLNSQSGISLRYGKYTVAKPSGGLAINETGEAAEVRGRFFSLAHLVRRESAEGVADDADDDSDVWILQLPSFPIPQLRQWSGVASGFGLWGEDSKDATKHRYWTAGVEGRLSRAGETTAQDATKGETRLFARQLSVAYFHSEREGMVPQALVDAGTAKAIRDGRGQTALLTYTYTRLSKKSRFSVPKSKWRTALIAGFGTGDDASTPDVDEGYVGETVSFGPDKLFLSTFAQHLDGGDSGVVGKGLSNKAYVALSGEVAWSPLRWIAHNTFNPLLDPESERTILTVHYYRAREGFADDKELGIEVNLDFEIEVPMGLRATVGLGKLFRGEALKSLMTEDPWTGRVAVSVSFE